MAEPKRFTATDGVGIAYRTWNDGASGPPVALHHGFIANAHLNWELTGVVGALEAAGRRVIAPDARGHGDSDKPHDPARYGEARMALDLAELFDLLGVGDVDLVGYSMGGVVSLICASQEPRIRRLVIGGVGSAIVELGGVDTRVFSRKELAVALRADDASGISDPGIAAFREFSDALGGDRFAYAAQADSVHSEPIPLDLITAPTLVLVGSEDPLASRPEVLAAAIPDARVRLIPGDHMGAVAGPDFAPAVVEFLAP